MPDSPREIAVRDRLAKGLLPHLEEPPKVWMGKGTGRPCDGCGEPIRPDDIETEIDLDRTYRFHEACLKVWRQFR